MLFEAQDRNQTIWVTICGSYGKNNAGDDAILKDKGLRSPTSIQISESVFFPALQRKHVSTRDDSLYTQSFALSGFSSKQTFISTGAET